MRALKLLGLLLVAIRPTRTATIEPWVGCHEPLGSGQANAATTIASWTSSDTMAQSQEWAMLLDEPHKLHFPVFEYSTLEGPHGESMLARDMSNINRVDQFGECSSMNEWDSSPGSKIDASHINIDSQQLSQEGGNLDYLIDPDPIPTDLEMLPSKNSLENLVFDSSNAHQFDDSSFTDLADWNPSTTSTRDAFRISIDGQQSTASVEGETSDCRIGDAINSNTQAVDIRKKIVRNGFPEHTKKICNSRDAKYLVAMRMLSRVLNWDLDEVKDYESLCVFLGKETNAEQVEFHNRAAITENVMKLLLSGRSGQNTDEVGQNNIDVPQPRLIAQATSTMQKLIFISNFVLKLVVSCARSPCKIRPNLSYCLKRICIPVLRCLVQCCGKDMDLFQARWGTPFLHRSFGVKCCPGRGSNHDTCGYNWTKIVRNPVNRDNSGLLDLKALIVAVQTSTTAEEKLNLCREFNEKYRSSDTNPRHVLQSFHGTSQKPIWGCYVHHCGQDISEWIRKWGAQFTHGSFGRRKCHGLKSLNCGSIEPLFDIPARLELRHKSTRDLLPALSEILKEYDQFVNEKTAPMRSAHRRLATLVSTCFRPLNNCLHHHCAGSVEEFVRRWGDSVHYTKFSRDCCPGPDKKESDICRYNSLSRLTMGCPSNARTMFDTNPITEQNGQ